ncbi:MFS transporter [Chryseolinea lacunae]|uniref:MFS transporter n=1 Tax=Chryseolinea lacunae TaxID=2801331 RepID=A0ABS1KVW2_9BACT|nr:MFS transporter [Chryseolinea lacunae]MBL0743480.1 MFS transporter [Chryseolinea lacunae]
MKSELELPATPLAATESVTAGLWITFGICLLSNIFGGTVSTLMSVYLPVVVKEVMGEVSPERLGQVSAYINALYILGWAFGGFTWGIISDRIGRSKALVLAVGLYGLLTVATGFSRTWEMVVACRLLAGFGVGGVLVISATLLSEVWPARTRSIAIGILSIGFPIGVFSAGLVNYIVSDWRQGFLIGALPVAVSMLAYWVVQESEKWRLSQIEPAANSMRKNAQLHSSNLVKGSLIFGSMLIGLWAIFSWLPTWVQSLVTTDGQTERGLAMMLLGAGGLSGGFFSGWIAKGLGVRRAMMLCFGGCCVLSVLLFKLNTTFSPIIYAEIGCLALFFGISQGLLSAYIPQLFPIDIRATATGFCFNIGRIVTAAAVFFIGALVSALGGYGNAILTFSVVFLIGLVTLSLTKDDGVNVKS